MLTDKARVGTNSLSRLGRRNTVFLLELIRKIIAVVEAAGVGNLTNGAARLVLDHILRTSEAAIGQILVKADAHLALEGAAKMLGADAHKLGNMRQAHVRSVI